MITVPIDRTLLSDNEATVIVFHEQGFTDEFVVFLDRETIGTVTSETPLKFSVMPGQHKLHTQVTGAIDCVKKQYFEAGQVYHMRIWPDIGFWVSSIRIEPADERDS